ncbi:DUF2723 domain-containing protein [Candidatus Gottesmanbacteria bacterium]|nr:DUF2723 domain-containing protein [Candidatus Gottesmanbacteria bacterium]
MIVKRWMIPWIVGFGSFVLFLFFQVTGIFGGDSGDLVTAAYEFGVPHPPGYPLYTWLVWLATRLPLATPAWRAALMSSVPHAITVAVVYLLVLRITKSALAGVFAAVMLAGNYLFFLYSVTPEVFALFDLFLIVLLYLLIQWEETENPRWLYLVSFIFSMSLTHHHVTLFLLPAMVWLIYRKIRGTVMPGLTRHPSSRMDSGTGAGMTHQNIVVCGTLFILGLLPYLYIPLAARGSAIVNWDRAVDWEGFVRLLTRQDYGSFVANGFYGALPIHRLLQVKAYAQFLLMDVTWVGILLAVLGFIQLWRQKRKVFWLFFLAIVFLGPGFFFYASFPLMNRFSLGTYERFLLPSYTLLGVLMGVGVSAVFQFSLKRPRLFRLGTVMVMFAIPVSMLAMTLWRFWGLSWDKTADHLGEDMMQSLPSNALLLVSRDTPLFVSQYVRYASGFRPDIMLLHTNRLWMADYPQTLKLRYPRLTIEDSKPGEFARGLIRKNRDRTPIYSNTTIPLDDGWFWVQEGLVYRLVAKENLPTLVQFLKANDAAWSSYHDPRLGILSRYRHLMVSDILSVYADARIAVGKILLRGGNTKDAKRYFLEAIAYESDIEEQDGYTYLGLVELFEGNCDGALAAFTKASSASLVPSSDLVLYESYTYRDACDNAKKASELMQQYESSRAEHDIRLGVKP